MNMDKPIERIKDELQQIIPGFTSIVLFKYGTQRQTMSAIDDARKQLYLKDQNSVYRITKSEYNKQEKFIGVRVKRYNVR